MVERDESDEAGDGLQPSGVDKMGAGQRVVSIKWLVSTRSRREIARFLSRIRAGGLRHDAWCGRCRDWRRGCRRVPSIGDARVVVPIETCGGTEEGRKKDPAAPQGVREPTQRGGHVARFTRAVLNCGATQAEWKKKKKVEAPIDATTKDSAL